MSEKSDLITKNSEIKDVISQLQQNGGGKIKVEHTIKETLSIEVGNKNNELNINNKKVEEKMTIYPEIQTLIAENSKSEKIKANQGAEISPQKSEKAVEIPVNPEAKNNGETNGGGESTSGSND
jgi:hypothetical protein